MIPMTTENIQKILTTKKLKRYKEELIYLARISFGPHPKQLTGWSFTRQQLRALTRWGVLTSQLMIQQNSQVIRQWTRATIAQ